MFTLRVLKSTWILSFILTLGLRRDLFPFGCPLKFCMQFSSHSSALHAPPVSSSETELSQTFGGMYKLRSSLCLSLFQLPVTSSLLDQDILFRVPGALSVGVKWPRREVFMTWCSTNYEEGQLYRYLYLYHILGISDVLLWLRSQLHLLNFCLVYRESVICNFTSCSQL
jgi:hypothetical protein